MISISADLLLGKRKVGTFVFRSTFSFGACNSKFSGIFRICFEVVNTVSRAEDGNVQLRSVTDGEIMRSRAG